MYIDHPQTRAEGFCNKCGRQHLLCVGNTLQASRQLQEELDKSKSIYPNSIDSNAEKKFSTSSLFGPARGKMFGLLECRKPDGSTIVLRAFSGQYNGRWSIDGWAPPLFNVGEFEAITTDVEKEIKQIGSKITEALPHSAPWLALRKERRQLSQKLMKDIHALYTLTNFRGETTTLLKAYTGSGGIPTGTGDCCAPKLLNFAARKKYQPLGIAEFYWGKENSSGSRQHGCFYSSCLEKCQPVLGFMLCGLDDCQQHNHRRSLPGPGNRSS